MQNRDLAQDYLRRARARLLAVDTLFEAASWADVVRESQEIVELALTGFLRACGVEPPRIHDMADVLIAEQAHLPESIVKDIARLTEISRTLRRDRELSFYGAEDLTPTDFYKKPDAVAARDAARFVVDRVLPHVG